METIFVPLALLAGGLLPIQAGANAQLSKSVASPFAATTLQLLVGAAVLLVITILAGSLAALAGLSDVPWWHAIGGLASALYVVSGILLFPRLGAVATAGMLLVFLLTAIGTKTPRPQMRALPSMPWWGWLGGSSALTTS
jgi:transporter family-2 protein